MDTSPLITDIVDRLKNIAGIEALVLGGSRARGTHTEKSDIDLGIYYHPTKLLDLNELSRVATEIDDEHRVDVITDIGGWGPWINGGGWLRVKQIPVDFLYKDLEKIERIITDCCEGRIEIAYQPGHPHAFESYIYLSEVALCQPLWDPHGTLARLKSRVQPYPLELKRKIIQTFWWEAGFSVQIAHKSIARKDVVYAAGCCFRCVACLCQTLFAVNEQYWMNEKGAVAIAAGLEIAPSDFRERVEVSFTHLSGSAEGIEAAIHILEELLDECKALVELAS